MQNIIVKIQNENEELLADEKIGCFIVDSGLKPKFTASFVQKAHEKGKLVLMSGTDALDNYANFGADGVVINTVKDPNPKKYIKEVQNKAPKAILGVVTRNRRHEAMLVSECEPDFLIFKVWEDGLAENLELLDWYNEMFLLQFAAQIEENFDFSKVKADFLILDEKKYKNFVAK
jgi:hypothetical protein